jgi:hypothetical protein
MAIMDIIRIEPIASALNYLMASDVESINVNLGNGKVAKIYWVGSVLRVDIEGLEKPSVGH